MKKILVSALICIIMFVGSVSKSDAWGEDYVVEIYGYIYSEKYGLFNQKTDYLVCDQYGLSFGNGGNQRFETFMQQNVGEYIKVTIRNFDSKIHHGNKSIFKYGNFDVLEWEIITEEEFLETELIGDEIDNTDSYNIPYDKWKSNKENIETKKEDNKEVEYEKRIKELEAKIKELEELSKSK